MAGQNIRSQIQRLRANRNCQSRRGTQRCCSTSALPGCLALQHGREKPTEHLASPPSNGGQPADRSPCSALTYCLLLKMGTKQRSARLRRTRSNPPARGGGQARDAARPAGKVKATPEGQGRHVAPPQHPSVGQGSPLFRQRAMMVLGTAATASIEGMTPATTLSRKAW